jgi:hypothetical protein
VLLAAGTCVGQGISGSDGGHALKVAVPDDARSLTVSAGAACDPSWLPTFGLDPGMSGSVLAMTVFDDASGGGPALYAAGSFGSAGGAPADHIAKWNGTRWSALGAGLNDWVSALAVFDDGSGSGPALYAGGFFNRAGGVDALGIAKWDGTSWSEVGEGVGLVVYALTVFDDGSGGGPALYAGGTFGWAGGVEANRIAKWDGTTWSPLGSGMSGGIVRALTVFDDGGGPALYAGGSFTIAGGTPVNRIAKWNGTSWSALGGGMTAPGSSISALAVFDDGSGGGPALYAGGNFAMAGGATANGIAKWNGTSWSALGTGLIGGGAYALTAFDDGSGSGPSLYAGGYFTAAGGVKANYISKWDGTSWSALGSEVNGPVIAMTVFDDDGGDGTVLCAGGEFTSVGGLPAICIAKWNGRSWLAFGTGVDNAVRDLTVFDDGDGGGPALYAGGNFDWAGEIEVNGLAKWSGTSWSALDIGVSGVVQALTTFDDGSGGGPALCAGGNFTSASGTPVKGIAKWNGTTWSALGGGIGGGVHGLTVFDDGSGGGPALYAGGYFSAIDSGDSHIARWGCETSACPWDCGDRNGIVDIVDFLAVLSEWGLAGTSCDIDGAGTGPKDFSNVMAHWGPCP